MRTFDITNKHECPMCLIIEPEGIEFNVEAGGCVTVVPESDTQTFEFVLSSDAGGTPCVAIWPCRGRFQVLRNGHSIFDELG